MVWITVISTVGTALIILICLLVRRCSARRRSQMNLHPDSTDHYGRHHKDQKGHNKKRVNTIFTRDNQWTDHETSGSHASMVARPKDFIHPVSSSVNERRTGERKSRRSFIASPAGGTAPRREPDKRTQFKLNSDSESEEEIYDPRRILATKDLSKRSNEMSKITTTTGLPPSKLEPFPGSATKVVSDIGFPFKYTLYR